MISKYPNLDRKEYIYLERESLTLAGLRGKVESTTRAMAVEDHRVPLKKKNKKKKKETERDRARERASVREQRELTSITAT